MCPDFLPMMRLFIRRLSLRVRIACVGGSGQCRGAKYDFHVRLFRHCLEKGIFMIEWFKKYHIPIDTMGGIIATGITIGAFVIAYGQYVTQSKIENERQAKQAYYDFMEISMNNPLYSKPGLRDEPLTDL